MNAATFGACTRVHHNPVYISFTTSIGNDTADNILETGEFVVNLPAFDEVILGKAMVVGLPFAKNENELAYAGLTAISSEAVKPPRILECPRHFECKVDWTKRWVGDRPMVCGLVYAASVDADCIDAKGCVGWNKDRAAHYCGALYGDCNMFLDAYEAIAVDVPYRGPERRVHMVLSGAFRTTSISSASPAKSDEAAAGCAFHASALSTSLRRLPILCAVVLTLGTPT